MRWLWNKICRKKTTQSDIEHPLVSAIMELRVVAHDLRETKDQMAQLVEQLKDEESVA